MWAFRFDEIFPIVCDLGYAGVEIHAWQLRRTGEDPQTLARLAQELRLILTVHAYSWDLNITSDVPEIRALSQKMTRECVALAARLNASVVVVHPGRISVPGDSAEEYWQLLLNFVRALGEDAQHVGITIGLEHMERLRNEFLMAPEDMRHAMEHLEHVPVVSVFDAAHVPWGEDLVGTFERMPRVGHVHLSDATADSYHLAVGRGQRDLGALIAHLEKTGYPGLVTIEGMEQRKVTDLAETNIKAISALLEKGK